MENRKIQYLVEGKCEKQMIEALKKQPSLLCPGKVKVFNPVTRKLTPKDFVTIEPRSVLAFVFDTDTATTGVLDENLKMAHRYAPGRRIVLIPQVKNLEDELVRFCNIESPVEITNSRSLDIFKTDFCALRECRKVLERHGFDLKKLWILSPDGMFKKYAQESNSIKNR